MRILTHSGHTAYDFELAKTGHDFFSISPFWDGSQRPQPANWTLIPSPPPGARFDGALAATHDGLYAMRGLPLPMIFKWHDDVHAGAISEDIESRVMYVVFNSVEAAERWRMRTTVKKVVIEHSIDATVDRNIGDFEGILAVGSDMVRRREEKGTENLLAVCQKMKIHLIGFMNEGLPCAHGHANDFKHLSEKYYRYRVFFNPAASISMSTLEAMAAGMPVVTFSPTNFRNLIRDGWNGYVVRTPDEAVARLQQLMSDEGARRSLGSAARETIAKRMSPARFQAEWNALFGKLRRWV